jgi:hypothetical protein
MEVDPQTSVDNSANESLSSQVTLFIGRLECFQRAPRNLVVAWNNTQHAGENYTAKIFLQKGGFAAWIAYLLAKNAADRKDTYGGKFHFQHLITNLEKEPYTSRTQLATRLATAINSGAIQPDVKRRLGDLYDRKIQRLLDNHMSQERANKRRRKCPSNQTAILLR